MPSKPGRDDRVTGFIKHPFLDLGKAYTNVFVESTIDGYAGHTVCWVSKKLEMGFRFTHALERCGVASLHVDAYDVPRIAVH